MGNIRASVNGPFPLAQARPKRGVNLRLSIATLVAPSCHRHLVALGKPSARELAQIIAAVGLLGTLLPRALVTDGIPKGHMALQAQSLATESVLI